MSTTFRRARSGLYVPRAGGGGGGGLSSYDTEVAADAPIFYLKMAETTGTVAADASGHSRPGVIAGAPTLGATKVMPTGTSSYTLDDGTKFVVVPDGSDLDVASFSAEAWVTMSATSSYHNVFNRDGSSDRGWNIYIKDGQVSAFDGVSDHLGSATIPTGKPTHLVATCDSSTVKVYINGILDLSFAAAAGWTTNAGVGSGSNDFAIGAAFAGTGVHVLPLSGNIDHVAYYGSVLSAARVAAHFRAGYAGLAPTFATSSTNRTANSIAKPAGLGIGDHLLIVGMDNSASPVTGAGLISLGDYWQWGPPIGDNYVHVLYRQIDGTEGSSFATSGGASGGTAWTATAWRGGNGPPALIGGTALTALDTSMPSHLMAPVDGTAIHVFCAAQGGTPTITPPASGVTERTNYSGANFWSISVCDEVTTAGTDTTRSATVSASAAIVDFTFILPTAGRVPAAIGNNIRNAANSPNASIDIPSYAQAGDMFIVCVNVTANTITAGIPGFTAIDGPGTNPGGAYTNNYWWGYKILSGPDIGTTVNLTSGNQVWGAAGVLIRNPAAVPIGVTGTPAHAASATATMPGTVSPSVGRIAVSAVMASTDGNGLRTIDTSTDIGAIWKSHTPGAFNYGIMGLIVSGVTPGGTSLSPDILMGSLPSWEANTVLLNVT